MKTIKAFLIIGRNGSLSVRKNRPFLNSDEVSFKLNVSLPDDFFDRIIPVVDIEVPKEAIYNPEASLTMDLMSEEIASKLNLEISEVRDGLVDLMKKKLEVDK